MENEKYYYRIPNDISYRYAILYYYLSNIFDLLTENGWEGYPKSNKDKMRNMKPRISLDL